MPRRAILQMPSANQNLKNALSQVLKHSVTAIATAKDYIYAGDSEGRLQVSADAGVSWGAVSKLGDSGKVEAIWVDPSDLAWRLRL